MEKKFLAEENQTLSVNIHLNILLFIKECNIYTTNLAVRDEFPVKQIDVKNKAFVFFTKFYVLAYAFMVIWL